MIRKIFSLLLLLLLTLTAVPVAFAGKPVHKLNSFQTSMVQEDEQEFLRIEIGMNRKDLEYSIREDEMSDQQLVINLENTKAGKLKKDMPLEYELASGVKIQEPEKKHTVVTVSLKNDVRDGNYKVYTLEEDKKEKKPYRLVIDIFPPNPMKQKIYGVEGHSIVLDPGHGGSDSGAIGPHGVQEKDITLVVAMKTKELLEKSGANVIMTRETDRDVYGINATDRQELQARVNVGERARKAEVFVSIHCNAFSNANAHGMETYYYETSYRGRKLATFLNEELAEFGGLSNRGILTANFYVLKHSRMPASLIELGFITNYEEEAYLDDEEYQDRLAFAIANALGRYFQ